MQNRVPGGKRQNHHRCGLSVSWPVQQQKADNLQNLNRRRGGLHALQDRRNEGDSMSQEDHIDRVIGLAATSEKTSGKRNLTDWASSLSGIQSWRVKLRSKLMLAMSGLAPNKRLLATCFAALLACWMMTTGSHGQNVNAAPPDPQSKLQTDRQGQSSAEENMGQIDTHSGGAPASSPQGDTPAGMQPIPSGSDPPSPKK
jgi:hypothetical protein